MKYIVFELDKKLHCVFDTGCIETAIAGKIDIHTVSHGEIPAHLEKNCEHVFYTSINPALEYDLYFRQYKNVTEIVDKHINDLNQFDFSLGKTYAPCVSIPLRTELPCTAIAFEAQVKYYKTLLFYYNKPSSNKIIFKSVDVDTKQQAINTIDAHIAKKYYHDDTVYFDTWVEQFNKYYKDVE
jgi:hypothetical protein